MYRVEMLPKAQRFYAKADLPLAKKLARCFEQLARDPRDHPNITPLRGRWSGYYRYRVGDYRVVYLINDAGRVVVVSVIGHRREIYE